MKIPKKKTALKEYLVLMNSEKKTNFKEIENLRNDCEKGRIEECVSLLLPLVVEWVNSYRGKGYSFEELIEEGNRALIVQVKTLAIFKENGLIKTAEVVKSKVKNLIKVKAEKNF
jgi:DNA-directed RNA polymerase sigma subunit (sigma70/sigma32)